MRWLRAAASFSRNRTATEGLFYAPALARLLQRWTSAVAFDGCIFECSSMAPYVEKLSYRGPTVLDLVDLDSQKWQDYADHGRGLKRALYRLEGQRLDRLEAGLLQRVDALTFVSEAEADLFRRRHPNPKTWSLPNGVDRDYFQPGRPAPEGDTLRCAFLGALNYFPNVEGIRWFCNEVWPEVHRRSGAVLDIIGREPTSAVQKLAAQPGVEVIGPVKDVRPCLQRATLFVVPLRIARGVQNKVLEAMSMGLPVIASSPALEGIAAEVGRDVLMANSPDEWIAQLSGLLADQAGRRRLAEAGSRYVQRNHNWESCLSRLGELLRLDLREDAAAQRRATAAAIGSAERSTKT